MTFLFSDPGDGLMLEKSPYTSPGTPDLYTAVTFGVCRHTRVSPPPSGSELRRRRSARLEAPSSGARARKPHTSFPPCTVRRGPVDARSAARPAPRSGREARPRTSPVAIARVLFQRMRIHMWIATRRPRASPPSTERSCADIPSRIPSRSWHHRREERDDRAGGRRLPGRRAGATDAR